MTTVTRPGPGPQRATAPAPARPYQTAPARPYQTAPARPYQTAPARPYPTAPPRRSPSTAGYWVAAVLALATPVVAVAVLVLGLSVAEQRIDGLARTAVPGTVTLAGTGSRTMTVYAEGDLSDATLTVTGPDGPVVLSARAGTPAYERDGVACVAVASFATTSTGRYVVRATGEASSGTRLAVGPDVTEAVVASAVAPYVSVGLGLSGLVTIALVTYRRREAPPERTWW
jgi:hypothetical protein